MWNAFYSGSAQLGFALGALVFFIVFFAGVVVVAFSRRREPQFNALAQLPLSDEPAPQQTSGAAAHESVRT